MSTLNYLSPALQSGAVSDSCGESGTCVVALASDRASDGRGQVELNTYQNGTPLTSAAAPLPSDGEDLDYQPVNGSSCGTNLCAVVGGFGTDDVVDDGQIGHGLIETFANGEWSATDAPLPSDVDAATTDYILNAVSCVGSNFCVAVGVYPVFSTLAGDFGDNGLIETYSNGAWTPMNAPAPPNAGPQVDTWKLSSVSCSQLGSCVAVGQFGGTALIERLSNGTWTPTVAPSPAGTQSETLTSVSCAADNTCTAVGTLAQLVVGAPGTTSDPMLIETFSNNGWVATAAPYPPGIVVENPPNSANGPGSLDSVYCNDGGKCFAAGDIYGIEGSNQNNVYYYGLIETLVSGTWSAETIPYPLDLQNAENPPMTTLSSISCSNAVSCAAVGTLTQTEPGTELTSTYPIIDTLSNGSWATYDPFLPSASASPSIQGRLSSAACNSHNCFAIGSFVSDGLAEGLLGTETVDAQTSTPACVPGSNVTVPGTANPWGASLSSPPAPAGNGTGTVPPCLAVKPQDRLNIAASGQVVSGSDVGGTTPPNGPDGLVDFSQEIVNAVGGISGISTDTWAPLVGVFATDSHPSSIPPPSLDFRSTATGTNFSTLTPQLWQPFYIGDGVTSTGSSQTFEVPSGATRLYLGVPDCNLGSGPNAPCTVGDYSDNSGSFSVIVSPSAVPASGFVDIGDSYSAGEGDGNYIAGTDTFDNQCHRSPSAYGPLLDKNRELGSFDFVACSGAITDDLISPNNEGNIDDTTNALVSPQFYALSSSTKYVTLTIGGNDLGFSDVLKNCIFARVSAKKVYGSSGCSKDQSLTNGVQQRLNALAGRGNATTPTGVPIQSYASLFAQIHQWAPNATVYIADYPNLFGSFKGECGLGSINATNVPHLGSVTAALKITSKDAAWLDSVASSLAITMRKAANSNHVTFVDVSPSFKKHRLCDQSSSWISPVSGTYDYKAKQLNLFSGSFHPTAKGQKSGYESAFLTTKI
jgi:hypothetical protein